MQKIYQNHSLKKNNTFAVDIACSHYAEPSNISEIEFLISYAKERAWPLFCIGEGSNLLFINTFEGLILRPKIEGIEIIDESESEILIRAGAGINWDHFVSFCVKNKYFGTENLSKIPGSVGAAPVQNIGAYGVEAKDIIEYVEVFDTYKMEAAVFSKTNCQFGYRDSVFKHANKHRYIVTHVVFSLKKNAPLKLDYGKVREALDKLGDISLENLRKAIISIRSEKLPDPEIYGNAGSFFKNPIIFENEFENLVKKYSEVPSYPSSPGKRKIPAAWLIEKAGWKGIREKAVGTWPGQPLVIVNYSNATGKEIFDFSEKIRLAVLNEFSVSLEREVLIV